MGAVSRCAVGTYRSNSGSRTARFRGECYLRDRFAMGRRGQGQARRSADRRARHRRPLSGGQQRRPHGRRRRPDLQALAHSQRHPQPAACSASSPAAWCSTRPASCRRSTAWSARGVKVGSNLMLSDRAHVIFPWHIAEDAMLDKSCASGENIGTTMRGIGPCYRDKVGRSFAVRLGDLYRDDFRAADRAHRRRQEHSTGRRRLADAATPLDAAEIVRRVSRLRRAAEAVRGRHDGLSARRGRSRASGCCSKGAKGRCSTSITARFPFVTSSNSSGVGVSSGSGVPGRWINKVIGVVKAYSTRVGGGPFPTEQDNEIGQHIRDRGNEYGTVTRRPRRCGWFDAVAVRYTARLSGVDALAVMLLDVLSELPELKICTAYEIDGQRVTQFPQPRRRSAAGRAGVRDRCPAGRRTSPKSARMADLPASGPQLSGPAQRTDRPAGGSRFGRAGPRADDLSPSVKADADARCRFDECTA